MPAFYHTCIHQPLDNGSNSLFQKVYKELYSSKCAIFKRILKMEEKVELILMAYGSIRSKPSSLSQCWNFVGQPSGRLEPLLLPVEKFSVGKPYRLESLPKVNRSLLNQLFDVKELVKTPGDDFTLLKHDKTDELAAQIVSNTNLMETKKSIFEYSISRKRDERGKITNFFQINTQSYNTTLEKKLETILQEMDNGDDETEEFIQENSIIYTGRLDTSNGTLLSFTENESKK